MQERVGKLLSRSTAEELQISTFHSLGVRILREEARRSATSRASRFSMPPIAPASSATSPRRVDKGTLRRLQAIISNWKNALVTPEAARQLAGNEHEALAAHAYLSYEATLKAYQAMDFDDLIGLPVGPLPAASGDRRKVAEPPALPAGRRIPGHQRLPVPVAQAADRRPCPVHRGGRRRSGDLRLARCRHRQPEEAAGRIPGAQGHQTGAELPVDRAHPEGGQQRHRPQREAVRQEAVVRTRPRRPDHRHRLQGQRGRSGRRGHEAAGAPFRAARQVQGLRDPLPLQPSGARCSRQQLRNHKIPYLLSGGQSFFDKAEIKDITAYLRLLANEDDDPAFIRAVTTPKRGIGAATLQVLGQLCRRAPCLAVPGAVRGRLRAPRPAPPARTAAGILPFHQPHPATRQPRTGAAGAARPAESHRLRNLPLRPRRRAHRTDALGQCLRIRRLAQQQGRRGRQDADRPGAEHRADQPARQAGRRGRSTPCSCRPCTPPRGWNSGTSSWSASRKASCRTANRSIRRRSRKSAG